MSSYDYVASAGMMPIGVIVAGPVSEASASTRRWRAMSVIGVAFAVALLAVPSIRNLPRGLARPPRAR